MSTPKPGESFFADIHELDRILQKTNATSEQCQTCGDSGEVWECHDLEACSNLFCQLMPCPDCRPVEALESPDEASP